MTALPESRYVGPTALCPEPERWSSTDGDSTEIEVSDLIGGLVRGLQPRLVVETGAAYGQTTRAVLAALDRNGHGALVTYETNPERLAVLPDHPRLTVAGDSGVADLTGRPPLDFAFLDSLYALRVPEFLRLRRWMRTGTIVAFHDSGPERGWQEIPSGRSLRAEIDHELVRPGLIAAIDLPTPRGLTIGEVL